MVWNLVGMTAREAGKERSLDMKKRLTSNLIRKGAGWLVLFVFLSAIAFQPYTAYASSGRFRVRCKDYDDVHRMDNEEVSKPYYSASSELTDQHGYYSAANCFDGSLKTTWAEGEVGDGIGSSISAGWQAYMGQWWVAGVSIWGGYQKNRDVYYKNNRPRSITIEIWGGENGGEYYSYDVELNDYRGCQNIYFENWVYMDDFADLTITINSVYDGNKYKDTCISELDLLFMPTNDMNDINEDFIFDYDDYSPYEEQITRSYYPRGLINEPESGYSREEAFDQVYPDFKFIDDGIPGTSTVDTDNWTLATRFATAGGDFYRVVNCNEWISARTEADTSAEVLQRFYLGEVVWVIGTWRQWSLCICHDYNEDNYVCGWSLSKYLAYIGEEGRDEYEREVSGIEEIDQDDLDGGWDPGIPMGSLQIKLDTDWVEMYTRAGDQLEVIARVPPGAVVDDCYYIRENEFILCCYEGEIGLIKKEFFDLEYGDEASDDNYPGLTDIGSSQTTESVEGTVSAFYPDSLYALYNNYSDQEYREEVGGYDRIDGRNTNRAGQIDGIDIGECGQFWMQGNSVRDFLDSLLNHHWYDRYSSEVELILSPDSDVTLVQSELYSWGIVDGSPLLSDEYYRFRIRNNVYDGYDTYDVLFRVGSSYEGGEWCEGRILGREHVAEFQDMLLRPKDIDDGFWVGLYRDYMKNLSNYSGIAILADFDLDEKPELLALSDDWPRAGTDGCFVKFDLDNGEYYTYIGYPLIGSDEQFVLTADENGTLAWYSISGYAGTGLFSNTISKIHFTESMDYSKESWLSKEGEEFEGIESNITYYIGERKVSYGEYQKEDAKWQQLKKLFAFNPYDYLYPDNWAEAISQYSIVKNSSRGEPITQDTCDTVSVSLCEVTGIKAQTYTGKAIKPIPTVKFKGKKLDEGTHYEVTYKNNKKIGLATVIIKGIGDYTGTESVTFKIKPKKVALSKLIVGKKQITVKWEKTIGGAGYQLQYSTNKEFKSYKTIWISKNATTKKVIKNLKSGKTYYVRIRAYKKVGSKQYYSAKWSKVKKAKIK